MQHLANYISRNEAESRAFYAFTVARHEAKDNTKHFPAWMKVNALQMAENTALDKLAAVLGVSREEARFIVANR